MDVTKDLEVMLGDPKKAIKSMMVPLIVSYLVVQLNIFADMSWCSGLGSNASSAVSSIFPIYWIISGFGIGIGVGASTSIARYLGRDDKASADSVATQTMVLAILFGVVVTPTLLLAMDPMITWMGIGDIRKECADYIIPMVWSSVILIVNGAITGVVRAEGAAKKSMVILLSAAILNIILDPILIYILDMGLLGAGCATAISTAISTAIGLYWYCRKMMYIDISFKGFRVNIKQMKDVLFVGIPRVTESTLISIMSLIQRFLIVPVAGMMGIAFYNVPWRYVSIAMVISQAAGSALIPVCSAALGQNDNVKAEAGYRYSFRITVAVMTIMAVFVFIFADYLVLPFAFSDSMVQYREEFAHGLRIYALFFPFMGMVDIGSSILQSLRMAQMSMVMAFIRNGFLVVLMLFAHTMDDFYWQLFATEVLGGMTMMAMATYEFRKYKRKRMLIGV
ncbi:MATE family efflux transporter [Candidatus Methanarcanum hacksteinii]|uniref:MATE family efflux transporter n=1 Tax=Candidatus Methanarcanum hacksteinii TaxID=2911857 RepID=UPI0037DD9DB1